MVLCLGKPELFSMIITPLMNMSKVFVKRIIGVIAIRFVNCKGEK